MRKRFLLLTAVLIVLIVSPIVYGALTQTQNISVSGTYTPQTTATPTPTPTPTPSPSPAENVQFSLWFPNGTALPSTLVNPLPPMQAGQNTESAGSFVVRNDGNVAATFETGVNGISTPSNLAIEISGSGNGWIGDLEPNTETTFSVGFILYTTGSYNPGQTFSYSFDVTITATSESQPTLQAQQTFLVTGTGVYPTSSTTKPSTVSVSLTSNADSEGSSIVCTATVSGTNPTGTITWSSNSTTGIFGSTATPLSSGTASTTYTDSTPNTVQITATYSGDSSNSGASGYADLIDPAVSAVSDVISHQTSEGIGVASYGLKAEYDSSTGTINYLPCLVSTNEVMGYANITSITVPSTATWSDAYTLQLNVVLQVTTASSNEAFWLQNVAEIGSTLGAPAFLMYDNIWNKTGGDVNMVSASGEAGYIYPSSVGPMIYGGGTDAEPLNLPQSLYPIISCSLISSQEVQVTFSYINPSNANFGNSIETYDVVDIPVSNAQSATILVTPYIQEPACYYDAEFVWGGAENGGKGTFSDLTSYLGLYYMNNALLTPFPSVYTFSCNTGETASNLQVWVDNSGYAKVVVGTTNYALLTNSFNPPLTLTSTATISSASAAVDQSTITGVKVSITGSSASDGTAVDVATTVYGADEPLSVSSPAQGTEPYYYDVQVTSNAQLGSNAVASITITNPNFSSQSVVSYWNGNSWVNLATTYSAPDTVTFSIPISDLSGTPIAVSNQPSSTPSPSSSPASSGQAPTSTSTTTPKTSPSPSPTASPTKPAPSPAATSSPSAPSPTIPELPSILAGLILVLAGTLIYILSGKVRKRRGATGTLLIACLFVVLFANLSINLSRAQTSTVSFSLWYSNGTAYPTSVTASNNYASAGDYIDLSGINVMVDWGSGFDSAGMTSSLVVLRNDGTVPLTVNVTLGNVNVPSDIELELNWQPASAAAYSNIGDSQWMGYSNLATANPVASGQYMWLNLIIIMMQTSNPAANGEVTEQVNYSFNIVVTATQAS